MLLCNGIPYDFSMAVHLLLSQGLARSLQDGKAPIGNSMRIYQAALVCE